MFADEIRAAVMAAPRVKLPDVAAVLWRAYGAGHVSEAEAEELSGLIETRKVVPAAPAAAAAIRKAVGSRPKTDASLERRRRWAASGRLPPALAARFTPGEIAVLSVVAAEACRRGDCRLAVGHLAAVAGVSETLVRNALREARTLGLVTIEERRVTAWRNDTNVVRIVSAEWSSWLKLAKGRPGAAPIPRGSTSSRNGRAASGEGRGGGCRSANPTHTVDDNPVNPAHRNPQKAAEGQGRRPGRASSWRG
ncbi:transcriptional regulator [Methylobacterium sp. SyP6R]|uniref:transcriptional regulator n=1 Tax=Methylobacterium sp. SyP6R TaxID=2718876 RepID=UPI001F2E4C6B|nr:transcriptional regulator [Methylobacterium sp. SyP6R]MCF4130286.1 transcriptional regulator [Methylobacterium sp. SyP6R]